MRKSSRHRSLANAVRAVVVGVKTHEELCAMTKKQLQEYAKEIGCCLGYDAARKDTTIRAIETHQLYNDRSW